MIARVKVLGRNDVREKLDEALPDIPYVTDIAET